ncbi:ATPase [Echria macrotheca]|uniref:ATPase n=1 Tax=Echria macrotheca TaxID=438768 RepID=A0AAJ0F800_9PEZI|nr:ATPase [Echria macrotheca]
MADNKTPDDGLLSSFVNVADAAQHARLRELVSRAPGKASLDDDEMPDVLYSVQYMDLNGKVIDSRVSETPLSVIEYATFDQSAGKKPVIEIRTRVCAVKEGQRPRIDQRQYDSGSDSEYCGGSPPPRSRYPGEPGFAPGFANRRDDDLKAFKAEKPEMLIHSPYLCAALSAVVGYYPGFTSVAEGTVIETPYRVVLHHWEALERYKDNQPDSHDAEYKATTAKHIDALLAFLRETFSEQLAAEARRWENPSGATATFDLLWLLLKPGEIVYRNKDGYLTAYVVSSVSRDEQLRRQDAYCVNYWDVTYESGRLRRKMHTISIYAWNGEREIASLPLIPARFVPGGTEAVAEGRVKNGRQYWGLAGQPSYREYDGPLTDRDGKRQGRMAGRVIVDCEGWERFRDALDMINPGMRRPIMPHHQGPNRPKTDVLPQSLPRCPCKECSSLQLPLIPGPFAGFDDLDPAEDGLPPNEALYLQVITDTIPAFILGQRSWGQLKVEHLTDVRPDQEAFKFLVLDDEIKLTVKALIGKFANSDGKVSPWPSDFVKHKGEGRIFLLHGSPGVGKTCTAECIAELTRRPLLSLTSGDIGTSTQANLVERSLNHFLALGERYGALVLLDEADVYLEARTTKDLPRNGLVSMFLRALEYYKGVLFLTTNRVEAFDDAFTSRIHVALHYRRLGHDDRGRIWIHNFERLEKDSGGKCYVPQSTRRYVLESDEVRRLKLNGREIRNALQTAVALAETEALEGGVETVTVGEKHLRAVVKMSMGFRVFLKNKRAGGVGIDEESEDGDDEGLSSSVAVAARKQKKGRRGVGRGRYVDDEDEEEDEEDEEEEEEDSEREMASFHDSV